MREVCKGPSLSPHGLTVIVPCFFGLPAWSELRKRDALHFRELRAKRISRESSLGMERTVLIGALTWVGGVGAWAVGAGYALAQGRDSSPQRMATMGQ